MRTILEELLRQEEPTSVYKVHTVKYKDLECFQFLYQKGVDAFKATAFTNGIWIAPTPAGVKGSGNGPITFVAETLGQVATIDRVQGWSGLTKATLITTAQLERVYRVYDIMATELAKEALKAYCFDVLSTQATMTPYTMVIANIGKDGKLFGSVSIDTWGGIKILSMTQHFDIEWVPSELLDGYEDLRRSLYGFGKGSVALLPRGKLSDDTVDVCV